MEPNQAPVAQPVQATGTLAQGPSAIRKDSTDNQLQKQQDLRSVFAQSVDYATTNQDLQSIFEDCGTIVRVTILKQRNGNPKGCAYIQFSDIEAVQHALMLSGTILRKRPIKVSRKRTNIRGMSSNRGHSGGELLLSKILGSMNTKRF